MEDAFYVCNLERTGDLDCHIQDLVCGQRIDSYPFLEGAAAAVSK